MQTMKAPRCRARLTKVMALMWVYEALMPQSTTRSAFTICSESLPATVPSVARQPA
jgi:hypothetical protein